MAVVRWGNRSDLLERVREMQREMDRVVSNLGTGRGAEGPGYRSSVYPPMNVYNDGEGFIVRAEVPGIEPSALDLEVIGDTLTVRGERVAPELPEGASYHRRERDFGQFRRSLTLPEKVDGSKITASCTNGILEVYLPHAEEAKARKVTISG